MIRVESSRLLTSFRKNLLQRSDFFFINGGHLRPITEPLGQANGRIALKGLFYCIATQQPSTELAINFAQFFNHRLNQITPLHLKLSLHLTLRGITLNTPIHAYFTEGA
jgi:hypothetical protein